MKNKSENHSTKKLGPFGKTFIQVALILIVACAVVYCVAHHSHHVDKKDIPVEGYNLFLHTPVPDSIEVVTGPGLAILQQSTDSDQSPFAPHGELINILIAIIAVSVTIMVGFQIFNTIEYKHAIKDFEEKSKKADEYIKYAKTNVDRIDGDHSRMVAYMLYYSGKPTWALGWICRAIKSYFKAFGSDKTQMDSSYPSLMKLCVIIIIDSIRYFISKVNAQTNLRMSDSVFKDRIIDICSADNNESRKEVLKRTYKDMIDSRIDREQKKKILNIVESDWESKIIEKYMTLLTVLMSDKDIEYAEDSSRQDKELFRNKVDTYKAGVGKKGIKELFNELTAALEGFDEEVKLKKECESKIEKIGKKKKK